MSILYLIISKKLKIWISRNLCMSRSRCALRRGSDSHWSGLQNSAQLSSTLRLAQPEGSSIPSASYRLVWQVGYCKQILYKLPKIRSRVGSNPGYGEPSYVGYQSEWGDYHTAGAEKWLYHQCCLVGTAITASCENQPILRAQSSGFGWRPGLDQHRTAGAQPSSVHRWLPRSCHRHSRTNMVQAILVWYWNRRWMLP